MVHDDDFTQLAWLEPEQNPFGIRVLDCRPFSTAMIAVTSDPNIAVRFNQLRGARGEEHRGKSPDDSRMVRCALSYPLNGQSRDGPLFLAQQMEDKWDIYLYDGYLYFARSWTGELIFRAAICFKKSEAVLTEVAARQNKVGDDPDLAVRMVDFLMKSHLYGKEVPHPLPRGLPEDKKTLATYSFSQYGRWASFGSFEDTTKVRVESEA